MTLLIKKFAFVIFVVFVCFACLTFFSACNQNESEDPSIEPTNVSVVLDPNNTLSNEVTTISATYKDNLFFKDAKLFDNDLALLSFLFACSSPKGAKVTKFFQDLDFSNTLTQNYESKPTKNSVAFAFANKKLTYKNKTCDLVAVTIRGFDYFAEWANNCFVGTSGNHQGFDDCAQQVLTALKIYLNTNNLSNPKIWLSGYSRGGAISNILALKILKEQNKLVTPENFFVYNFESPKGILKNVDFAYQNIHNITNSADPITAFFPETYGFCCGGTLTDIYDENVDNIIKAAYPNLELKSFVPNAGLFTTPQEFINYVLQTLLKPKPLENANSEYVDISTRAKYVENFQESAAFLFGLYSSFKTQTTKAIVESLLNMNLWQYLELLNDNGIYNFIKPYIDADEIVVDNDALKLHLKNAKNLILSHTTELLEIALSGLSNFAYLIGLHYPDINFALLKSYTNNA